LRISRARVEEDGPFSAFPGWERILVVLAGDGLVLSHGTDAPRARLRPLEPYRFDGGWTTTGALVGGAVEDFNVFWRPGMLATDVQMLRLGLRRARESASAAHTFVHVVHGRASVRVTREEEPFELDAGASLWVREPAPGEELDLAGARADCTLLVVRCERVAT
jgi:environmental stress-induced protein Ves